MHTDYRDYYPVVAGIRTDAATRIPKEILEPLIKSLRQENLGERQESKDIRAVLRVRETLREKTCKKCGQCLVYKIEQWIHSEYSTPYQYLPERSVFWAKIHCENCGDLGHTWDALVLGLEEPQFPKLIEKIKEDEVSETWKVAYSSDNKSFLKH